jgi:small subunit ribosomal protein S16
MEVKIRLRKAGKSANKKYNFKIVAIRSSASRDGRFLEILGYYDPAKKPEIFNIKRDRLDYWIKNGAQLSSTIASLVKRNIAK